jgi:hypothetical protein
MATSTTTDSIRYLATVSKFTYHNTAENENIIIEFRRAWWDNSVQDAMWYSQARNKGGEQVSAKHVTVDYAADILQRYREFIEVEYFTSGVPLPERD